MESSALVELVDRFYRYEAGLSEGDVVVLAVSGGIDSMALAHASMQIAAGSRFQIAHFDHQLRPDSRADRDLVREFASRAGVAFHSVAADVAGFAREEGLSIEEAARLLRYRHLDAVRRETGARCVAVAHHRDDQAETVLLRLIRGSGLRGLRAMRPVAGHIIRPLLRVGREDIVRYHAAAGFEYREDPTNALPAADRNRIRLGVLPALRDIRPGVDAVLARTADIFDGEVEVLRWAAAEALERCDPRDVQGALEICRNPLAGLPPGVVRAVLRHIAEQRSGEFLPRADVDAAAAFCLETKSGGSIRLGRSLQVRRSAGRLLFAPAGDWNAEPDPEIPFDVPGQIELPSLGATLIARAIEGDAAAHLAATIDQAGQDRDPLVAAIDRDQIAGPLLARGSLPADVFQAFGREDPVALGDYLAGKRVPTWRRPLTPLLVAGTKIAWVAGVEIGDFCRVRPGSHRLLELRLEYRDQRPRPP